MEKLIIENRTDLSMADVLPYIAGVVAMGRNSNDGKQYCYCSVWNNGIVIYSDLNKESDRLIVCYEQKAQESK